MKISGRNSKYYQGRFSLALQVNESSIVAARWCMRGFLGATFLAFLSHYIFLHRCCVRLGLVMLYTHLRLSKCCVAEFHNVTLKKREEVQSHSGGILQTEYKNQKRHNTSHFILAEVKNVPTIEVTGPQINDDSQGASLMGTPSPPLRQLLLLLSPLYANPALALSCTHSHHLRGYPPGHNAHEQLVPPALALYALLQTKRYHR